MNHHAPHAPLKSLQTIRRYVAYSVAYIGLASVNVQASPYFRMPIAPQQAVLQAFLQCDAQWLTVLTQHADRLPEIKPTPIEGAGGISYIAVPNRRQFDSDGQSRTLTPPFTVKNVAFNEFIDEITPLPTNTPEKTMPVYYWGFNTNTPISHVLPLIQTLLPKGQKLHADGDTWARIDVFDQGHWQAVDNFSSLKQQAIKKPERALIVQTHEGGGTRVLCGLQAAPLPEAELKRLRPDLSIP